MRVFIFLAVLSLAACTGGTPIRPHVPTELSPETRTVLSGEQAMTLAHQCSRISPGPVTGQWAPSAAQIDAFEAPLTYVLRGQLTRAGVTAAPRDYYRQYAGFIINGRRVIYVNGVNRSAIDDHHTPEHPVDWRLQAINICDGGLVAFGAEFDTQTRQVSNFAFNGAV